MAHDVFISHSSNDKVLADAICHNLESAHIRCWIAPRDVPAGATWAGSIDKAIGESKLMILIFSSHSNTSEYVMSEVGLAADYKVWTLPVRVENVAPTGELKFHLNRKHWLDAITRPIQQHLEGIRAVVEQALAHHANRDRAGEVSRLASNSALPSILKLPPIPSSWLIDTWQPGMRLDPKPEQAPLTVAANPEQYTDATSSKIPVTVEALPVDEDDEEALFDLAMAKLENGDFNGAIESLNLAITLKPDFDLAILGRAQIKQAKGDFDGAIADYDQAILVNPDNSEIFIQARARAKHEKGDFSGAIADYNQAVALHPTSITAYIGRAATKQAMNDETGAQADQMRAAELQQKSERSSR